MKEKKYDVAGLGSALLDLTVEVDDAILDELGLKKGNMHLIDEERSGAIQTRLKGLPVATTPGGSAANLLAGVTSLGGKSVFVGKVGSDRYGEFYIGESEKAGIVTRLNRIAGISGHAITFITPDSERTFATHLGASLHFGVDDIPVDDIAASRVLHMEGYLLEHPGQRAGCMKAIDAARKEGVMVSIDLADPALVKRNLEDFRKLVKDCADIVFANEDEAAAFTGRSERDALDAIAELCDIAVVKLGERGSIVRRGDETCRIPVFPVNAVNTNGAGDAYGGGFLYGISRGYPLERCGIIGGYLSSKVVSSPGARVGGRIDESDITAP